MQAVAVGGDYLPNISDVTGSSRDNIQPSNQNLLSGTYSACCNLGKDLTDICMGGGLCYRQDSPDGNFF